MSDSDCGKPTSQCPPAPRRRIVRCLPLAVLAGGLVLVLVFGVHDLISLSALRENRQDLTDFVAEVVLSGSSTMAEVLLPALVEGFALRHGLRASRETLDESGFEYALMRADTGALAARFLFRVGTTDEGFADLLANEADMVMALREIRRDERTLAREAGLGDMTDASRSRVLALDAVVPVVAASNPVRG